MAMPGGSDSMLCERYFVPKTIWIYVKRLCRNMIPGVRYAKVNWELFQGYVQESNSMLSSGYLYQGHFGI